MLSQKEQKEKCVTMLGRLAVDFGTSNTLLALFNSSSQKADTLYIPDLSKSVQHGGQEPFWTIPSVIHYVSTGEHWIGQQVLNRDLYDDVGTFRWMKRYIATRNTSRICVGGKYISFSEAAKTFLSSILLLASAEIDLADEEIALTVPVEAFEHYEKWLSDVAEESGLPRYRLIDEPSAAALGYGLHIQPNDVYLVFDFGGGTLDVSVVLIEGNQSFATGWHCRVLGKAGDDMGGIVVDRWLFQEVLKQNGLSPENEQVHTISRTLLTECERAKENLSFQENVEIHITHPDIKKAIDATFTKRDFEEKILDANNLMPIIDRTIRRALREAWEKGYTEDNIKTVMMTGGGSFIPLVRRTVQRIFGQEKVLFNHPLDAVACGAAAFIAGVGFLDHIQHDYAVRYVDSKSHEHKYRNIVTHGTPYPTSKPIDEFVIRASHEGQQQLGIAIFEIGNRRQGRDIVELVFDPSGAARVIEIPLDEEERRLYFWMNENNPTFLNADPPANKDEQRFKVEFSIDGNKRLLVTARDIKRGTIVLRNYPVVNLT